MAQRSNDSVQRVEPVDFGGLAVSTAKSVVKNRPVSVSLWALGLLLAAFANGFAVSKDTQERYEITLRAAEKVDRKELNEAMIEMSHAERRYYNSKGWFSCDRTCERNRDSYNMATSRMQQVKGKRDQIMSEARSEVGIWSTFGVAEVRAAFWSAWQSGKDWAARVTMYDAIFMAVGGRDETLVTVILKLVGQYIVNLTMGLIGMLFFFVYNVYTLIVSYGESALSGLAFFLLVAIAGLATVGTYLVAIYGTVAGGGIYLLNQAAKQAAVEGGRPGGRPRQVQYGGPGGPGYRARPHYE